MRQRHAISGTHHTVRPATLPFSLEECLTRATYNVCGLYRVVRTDAAAAECLRWQSWARWC